MACLQPDHGVLDPDWCVYPQSRLRFRGPARTLDGRFIAVVGGAEVFGRSVDAPFPALLEHRLGLPVVNLGLPNAGPDVFLGDEGVGTILGQAAVTVVQVLGAHNLTNRYYSVHPRRNDRFLAATPLLGALYPAVDFTEFNFTRHMLSALARRDPVAFDQVAAGLRATWLERMRGLLDRVRGRRILLLLPETMPLPVTGACPNGPEPLLVTEAMVTALAARADGLVRLEPCDRGDGPTGAPSDDREAAWHTTIADRLASPLAALLALAGP